MSIVIASVPFPPWRPVPQIKANFDTIDSRSKTVTFIIRGYCTLILDGWREATQLTLLLL